MQERNNPTVFWLLQSLEALWDCLFLFVTLILGRKKTLFGFSDAVVGVRLSISRHQKGAVAPVDYSCTFATTPC
jgi:hypothetical protein